MSKFVGATLMLLLACSVQPARAEELGEDGFVDSDGVKIHYVTAGKGPLVVLIHGFPDFWYTWRAQMPELAKHFQVVAIDMRGYNKSDQPEGVENYKMRQAGRRHRRGRQALQAGQGDHRRPRLGRHRRLDLRDDLSRQDRPAGHPQPAASQGAARELANNPAAAKELAVRPRLSEARRARSSKGRTPEQSSLDVLGQGPGGQEEIRRGLQAVEHGRDAQLLQGQLPARAVHLFGRARSFRR